MKKLLVFALATILVLASISPALAGNGNGGGGGRGNGHGRNGNTNSQQRLGRSGNGYGWQVDVITGVITEIDPKSTSVKLLVYGGKDSSLYDNNENVVEVKTDSSTRFLSKVGGEIIAIAFKDIKKGDTASVAIGSDDFADRITVGVDCRCIP